MGGGGRVTEWVVRGGSLSGEGRVTEWVVRGGSLSGW